MGGSPERSSSKQDGSSDGGRTDKAEKQARKSKLPEWLSKELGNKRTWKTFARCACNLVAADERHGCGSWGTGATARKQQ